MIEKIKEFKESIKELIKTKIDEMAILDKYILKQMSEVFLFGVIVCSSILLATEAFTQLIREISEHGVPFSIAMVIIILMLPQIFVFSIPISTLLATVMTINKLSLNSEITVMRACGISIKRIAKPVLSFAIVMTVVSLIVNELVVPQTAKQAKYLMMYSLQQKHIPEGRKNYTIKELKGGYNLKRLFYVQECKNKTLNNVTVLDLSKEDTVQLIQSKAGKTDDAGWVFEDPVVYTITPSTNKIHDTMVASQFTINFGIDNINELVKESTSEYNYFKLLKYIRNNKGKLEFTEKIMRRYLVELHDKAALPVTTLALALIGIPLAITPPRIRYNRGFLFSVLVIFIYYVIRAFSINMGEAGTLPPFIAAWLPVLIIFALGYFLYYQKAYKI